MRPKIQLKDFGWLRRARTDKSVLGSHKPPRCKAQSPSVRTFLGVANAQGTVINQGK
jgi:hypothetical protein